MAVELLSIVVAFILGLAEGFFVNLAATRLMAERPMTGRLRCTQSGHDLALWQALPLIGFIIQGGRCSVCGRRLPLSYPLIELAAGVLLALLYLADGWGLAFTFHALYAAVLLVVLVVDWRKHDIYVSVIAAGSVLGLAGSFFLPGVGPLSALVGAGTALIFFLLVYLLAKAIFRHVEEPLGAGDVLLATMMGLMLGFPNVVGALLIGPLLAGVGAVYLLATRRVGLGGFMPYGVALCAASIMFLVYPAPLAEALRLPALAYLVSNLLRLQ